MSAAVAAQPFDFSAVDEAATEAVVSGEIPGVVVLVGRGDDILLHRAWGFRRLVPEPAAMTRDTIFDIASLTKPVGTTLAVLSLVERGAIKLDAPLGRYLKEFRGAPYAEITIRRILTHTAGFPAYPANSAVAGGFPGTASSSRIRCDSCSSPRPAARACARWAGISTRPSPARCRRSSRWAPSATRASPAPPSGSTRRAASI